MVVHAGEDRRTKSVDRISGSICDQGISPGAGMVCRQLARTSAMCVASRLLTPETASYNADVAKGAATAAPLAASSAMHWQEPTAEAVSV